MSQKNVKEINKRTYGLLCAFVFFIFFFLTMDQNQMKEREGKRMK